MIELLQNNINSEFLIINFILNFDDNHTIQYKKIYYNIICEWLKIILDKYNCIYNWVFYINNLNYKIIRVFIFINKYNYPNMDQQNLIYLTNAFEFYNKNDINILELCKYFNINELKIIIEKEFNTIKNNLDSTKSNYSNNELTTNNIIENHFNIIEVDFLDCNIINKTLDSQFKFTDEINTDDINTDEINTDEINTDELNTDEINQEENKIDNKENKILTNLNIISNNCLTPDLDNLNIKSIGVSGVNKNTFIYELKKIHLLKHSDIYYNQKHNLFDNQIFKKIKENNKYYWILYDDSLNDLTYDDSLYYSTSTHSKETSIFNDNNLNLKLNTILSIINNKTYKYKK
jgi:hypothetical protein